MGQRKLCGLDEFDFFSDHHYSTTLIIYSANTFPPYVLEAWKDTKEKVKHLGATSNTNKICGHILNKWLSMKTQ